MTMANLSRFSFPRALGTLLSLLSAQITQACTLIPPDPAVGITYGVYFEMPWGNCTLPASIELWSQDTGANDKILNSYPVGPNPIGWAISNVEFIYLTVYFVLRDYHGQKATSPTYVIQPGPQIGDSLSASPSALSRISAISESIASASSKSKSGSTTRTTNGLRPSTSPFPFNTGSSSTSSPTSLPLGATSNHTLAIVPSATIGAVALVALMALVYWLGTRSKDSDRPPPYTTREGQGAPAEASNIPNTTP